MIRQRLEFLAGVMGIEVVGYAVMSNHFHCILRSRPDVVATWSDDVVAQKWWMLCPARKEADGSPAEPTEFEINAIRNDTSGLKEKRTRLSSISWFMRFVSERIARIANKQDACSGRFWEGRFKAQVLLDDAAILACMQYVDLNPIRAGIAKSPEGSDFTSVQDRLTDLKSAENVATPDAQDNRVEHGQQAGWLAPVALEPKRQAVRAKDLGRRASNKGCLSMGLADYLQLLDWTGRQIRSGKRGGAMPSNLAPLFERFGIAPEMWVNCVMQFKKLFRTSVGRPRSMQAAAEAHGHNRAISINSARNVFV
jgi:REP element-mobilizing transposase RayT